jgi:hypothetical protein
MDRSLGIATNLGHQRTPTVTLEADGMHGVRGSSPLSSTKSLRVGALRVRSQRSWREPEAHTEERDRGRDPLRGAGALRSR